MPTKNKYLNKAAKRKALADGESSYDTGSTRLKSIEAMDGKVWTRHDFDLVYSYREIPTSDAFIEQMAIKLIEFAMRPDTIVIGKFFIEQRLSLKTWLEWCKRNDFARDAYSYAMQCVGVNREVGGLTRRLDSTIVLRTMPMYDPQYLEMQTKMMQLRDNGGDRTAIRVIMNAIAGNADKAANGDDHDTTVL